MFIKDTFRYNHAIKAKPNVCFSDDTDNDSIPLVTRVTALVTRVVALATGVVNLVTELIPNLLPM